MARGMSEDYSHWRLGGDGRWTRRHLDADGEPLPDLQAALIEMHSQAPPQGPPPLSRTAARSPAWR